MCCQQAPNLPTLPILPSYLCCFSAVQPHQWFIGLWLAWTGTTALVYFQMPSLHYILCFATGILTYRRPPDIFLQVSSTILQVEQSTWCSTIWDCISSVCPTTDAHFVPLAQQEIWNQEQRLHALATNTTTKVHHQETWASDSHPIVIDSATSKTITPHFTDLIDPQPH